jgi:DnaJ-class molecular chaperone
MKRLESLNFYEILEVSSKASQGEIREAYEREKRTYNRDSVAIYSILDGNEIEEMLWLIEKAYETIGNEKRRQEYDRTLVGVVEGEAETGARSFYEHLPQLNTSSHPGETEGVDAEGRKKVQEMVSQSGFEYAGPALREIRETLKLDLREISTRTKVSRTNLDFIEAEKFAHLPALVYLKGFISEYAKCLGLDALRVAEDYVNRYRAWERDNKTDT